MAANTQSAVIQVKFVDQPKTGKKQGTIKTVDGTMFGVFPEKLGLFQPGRRYEVQYTERPYQGRTYRTITACEPVRDINDDTSSPLSESPSTSRGAEAEMAFATAVVAAAVQSQQCEFNAKDLARGIILARSVYREMVRQAEHHHETRQ